MAAPSALQALLSGVRRPAGSSQQVGPLLKTKPATLRSTGPSRNPQTLSSEPGSRPPQLDFFQSAGKKPVDKMARKRQRDLAARAAAGDRGSDSDAESDHSDCESDGEDDMAHALCESLGGSMSVAKALVQLGAGVGTEVQRKVMPLMANEGGGADGESGGNPGADVIAVAPTGSGKTLCYAAPVLAAIAAQRMQAAAATTAKGKKRKRSKPQSSPSCLVLVPTRELATQVGGVFSRLAHAARLPLAVTVLASKAALTGLGGAKIDVVVATPQRAVVALDRGVLGLNSNLKHVVLDEADRLLDDGFVSQVDTVLASCDSANPKRRIHCFTATLPPSAETLIQSLTRNPVKVVVGGGAYGGSAAVTEAARLVKQRFLFAGGKGEQGKVTAVRGMLRDGLAAPILLFVQSKERAADLFRELIFDGIDVDAIHADRSGAARSSAIARFRAGRLPVLIATDVLARGLDFKAVATVVNYDMPASAAAYIHRIGRTGRAGRAGAAVTLFTEEDSSLLRPVARVARASGAEVPDWMLAQRKARPDEAARMQVHPPRRKRVGGSGHAALPKRHRKAVVPKRNDFGEEEDEGSDRSADNAEDSGSDA